MASAARSRAGRILVIANPTSRRFSPRLLHDLRHLTPPDTTLDIHLTPAAGAATEMTRAMLAGARMVVAVGGDGTVSEVASALDNVDVPLGIVPAGSTNIIAQELGIPANLRHALALLIGPHRQAAIDVGRCNGRSFLHVAGAGLDSWMFEGTDPRLKRRIGWLAYVPPAIRSMRRPGTRFQLVTDGAATEVVSPLVLVANGGSIISPRLRLYPGIQRDDGWLDVLVFTPQGPLPILRTLSRLAAQSLERSPYVVHFRARHVELISDPPLPVQLDGDIVSTTPAAFSIAPSALRVIVPPRQVGDPESTAP